MGYSDYDEGAAPMGDYQRPTQQQRKTCGVRSLTLSLFAGASLVLFALSATSLPSSLAQRFNCHHETETASGLAVKVDAEPEFPQMAGNSRRWNVGKRVQPAHASHAVHEAVSALIRETDMTATNGTGALANGTREGQPVVAVNPTNPDNLVFTTTRFFPLPALLPVGPCFLAYSFDRGETWVNNTINFPLGTAPRCGEPQVMPGSDGTFYLLMNQVFDDLDGNMAAHPQLSKSTDGGITWSEPSVTPLYMQGAPKLRVDLVTGKVYANGASSWEYPAALSVSSDGGDTWAPFNTLPGPQDVCLDYQIPDLEPVCGFPGRSIAVHDGIFATAAEGLDGYPEMYVSYNDGVNFTTYPLTDSNGEKVANGTGPMLPVSGVGLPSDPTPWVSADPTKTGRFALMIPREYTLEVYVTENAGVNFTGPTIIDTPDAQRPAIDYGTTGLLGVMWRTNSSNILDAYTTVSFDGGKTFPEPLKVTHMSEPVGQNGQPGDRASFIAVTDEYAYVAWSDGRGDGLLDAVLAEVPLFLFNGTATKRS